LLTDSVCDKKEIMSSSSSLSRKMAFLDDSDEE